MQAGQTECQTPGDRHAACVWTWQLPSVEQQAAVACDCGHWFGVQVIHAACQTPGAAQAASVVIVQVPARAQQAPCAGCGHGFGPQTVAAPCQAPIWFAQAAAVRMRHSPLEKQQAPAAGHGGFGGQVVPATCQVPWQAMAVVTMQTPSWPQQARCGGCGHGFKAQVVASPPCVPFSPAH